MEATGLDAPCHGAWVGPKDVSKIKFVKSQTWCQDMARINGVLRPEGTLLPAQAVRPGARLTRHSALKGPFTPAYPTHHFSSIAFPQASWPGLEEAALQAAKHR